MRMLSAASAVVVDRRIGTAADAEYLAVERAVCGPSGTVENSHIAPEGKEVRHLCNLIELPHAVCAEEVCAEDGLEPVRCKRLDAERVDRVLATSSS
jgi:hypothetical protein